MNRQDRRKATRRNRGMLVTASLAAGSLFGYVGYTRPAFAVGSTCSVQGNVGTVSGADNTALVQSMTDCIADLSSGGVIEFDVDETTVINVTTPFVIDKSLTIQGSSSTDAVWPVFDGGKTFNAEASTYSGSQIFINETETLDLTLREIGLVDGYSTSYGGAVYFGGPVNLYLDSVKVAGNTAGGGGGAVVSYYVKVESTGLYQAKFTSNKAISDKADSGRGGAIVASGVSVEDAYFTANEAKSGGAINSLIKAVIKNSTFHANKSSDDGGAVFADTNSVAPNGAVASEEKLQLNTTSEQSLTLEIYNSNFTENRSESDGGAIRGALNSKISISNSSFDLNKADTAGGAISLDKNSELTVYATSFDKNESDSYGGAIFGEDSVQLTISGSSSFTENDSDDKGGAIYLDDDANLQVSETTFHKNDSDKGGAIYVYDDAYVSVSYSSFTSNEADSQGGAIYSYYRVDMNISDSLFAENYADGTGGAIYGYEDSDMDIQNSVFYSNISSSDGAAIAADSGSDLLVSNTTFYKNSATDSAVLFIRGDATIQFSTLYQNYSTDSTNAIKSRGLIIANSVIGSNPESDKTPVTGLDVDEAQFAFDNTDYVNFSLLSSDGDLKLEPVVADEVFSHLLPGADSPVVGASDPSPTLASDSPLRKDQLGNDRTFPSNIGAISTVGAAQSSPPSFSAPVPTTSPILTLEENKPFSQGETVVASVSNATRVESILIDDTEAEIISFEDGLLTFTVPELEAGSYSITGEFNSGTVIFDVGLVVDEDIASQSQELNVWTKKVSDTEVKVYAKNPINNGKIQFFVDDEEIAWVRAEDSDDPKLSEAQGAFYLVRTVELTDSKQAIEIFVDGVRAWRAAYTNR